MPKITKTPPRHPEEQRQDMYQQHELTKQVRRHRMHVAKKRHEAKREQVEYAGW